jgi:hypothetical protein
MVLATDFLAAYPTFTVKASAEINFALASAIQDCPFDRWGDYTDRAVMLKTAHLLAMDIYEMGAMISTAVPLAGGQASHTPSAVTGEHGDGDLDITTWGRQFKILRKLIIGSPITYFS